MNQSKRRYRPSFFELGLGIGLSLLSLIPMGVLEDWLGVSPFARFFIAMAMGFQAGRVATAYCRLRA